MPHRTERTNPVVSLHPFRRSVAGLRLLPLLALPLLALPLLGGCALAGRGSGDEAGAATPPPEEPPADRLVPPQPDGMPPPVAREFRGVWIATVANIDWPSEPGLPPAEQRAELVALLDRAAALRLNAVVFQVRPAADALYDSPHEPWSEYLTGEMGRAPEPSWDPLAFAVREAHRRGLELHAWFNPFRARHPSAEGAAARGHISRTRPELVREYGEQLWLDPGEEAAREHSLRVIVDVVRRYDVDGVHLDDYFYPYPIRGAGGATVDFPDDASWARYRGAGGELARNDWRRGNVDDFVRRLYATVKETDPRVKVGISPFGIWRPGHPRRIEGFDAYDRLYADARKWLREGWVDYLAPQLYWRIEPPEQSYPALLRWWVEQRDGVHLWPGLIPSRVRDRDPYAADDEGGGGWPAEEILRQIGITRVEPGATGNILFSMRSLVRNADRLSDRLAVGPYRHPALVPASPWLDDSPPAPPTARLTRIDDGARLTLEPPADGDVFLWTVRARYRGGWTTEVVPGRVDAPGGVEHRLDRDGEPPREVLVRAVDRAGNGGRPLRLTLPANITSEGR